MKEEAAKALHQEMLDRSRQAGEMAALYSVQFVQSEDPVHKATALRHLEAEALWRAAAELVRQARANG
ncbi:MAG TPA: hypothetical protein VN201_00920 [Roseateles sp.]|nr:hypothetical protein [Roseateles sp.]